MILPQILIRRAKNIGHLLLALIAVVYYGNSSKNLKVIGVTGTDGKTTTANYIYQLLEFAGKKVALISTVGVFMEGKKEALGFHVTTPSPFSLNKYFKKATKKNIEYLVLEVSSHALDQHRVLGINFEIGILTNITNEHLDYHRSFNNYLDTKIKLLEKSKKVILNKEDPFINYIKNKLKNGKIYTFSIGGKKSDFDYDLIKKFKVDELTQYNIKNLLASLLTLKLLDIDTNKVYSNLGNLTLPSGRFEYLKKSPYGVIIDFAHTPNAFDSLLPEIKKITTNRIIHVFGSAGKRDKTKRPDMGGISSKYSDVIILTSEDPRNENIHKINSDIRKGIDPSFRLVCIKEIENNEVSDKSIIDIPDRTEAIKFALNIAKKGDSIVITGKGPEESMNMGNGEIPWNDIEVTKNLIKKIYGN